MTMKKRSKPCREEHDRCVDLLVERLLCKYPGQLIQQNVNLYHNDKVVGEIDVLRHSPAGLVMYELKTGKYRYGKAHRQYDKIKEHLGDVALRGVYIHYNDVRRLR